MKIKPNDKTNYERWLEQVVNDCIADGGHTLCLSGYEQFGEDVAIVQDAFDLLEAKTGPNLTVSLAWE